MSALSLFGKVGIWIYVCMMYVVCSMYVVGILES